MFTYRDFEGGTLGLAWTGDLKNAGGVCEKNGVSEEICTLHLICSGEGEAKQGVIYIWPMTIALVS